MVKFDVGVSRAAVTAAVLGVLAAGALSGCMDVGGSGQPGSAGTPVVGGPSATAGSQDGAVRAGAGDKHRQSPGASSTAVPSPGASGVDGGVKPLPPGVVAGVGVRPPAGGSGGGVPTQGAAAGGGGGTSAGGATGAPSASASPTAAPPASSAPSDPPPASQPPPASATSTPSS